MDSIIFYLPSLLGRGTAHTLCAWWWGLLANIVRLFGCAQISSHLVSPEKLKKQNIRESEHGLEISVYSRVIECDGRTSLCANNFTKDLDRR
ncbi:hypothetical protein GCM10011273_10740 [Asticcacaulis endophyticus]|uniref:Uncharacterized protein n=1 Tax=Asticcacaulis endophyticus TaxID=1395890 RepID=A0A918PY93_9CAUL|nr:hypothetical protein GCM10011273_10740 [Asticcacaulis endophyticus]